MVTYETVEPNLAFFLWRLDIQKERQRPVLLAALFVATFKRIIKNLAHVFTESIIKPLLFVAH